MPGLLTLCVRVLAIMGLAVPALGQPAGDAVQPRIIVQSVTDGGIDVAAWTPDGRFIWTASGMARELLLWDAAQGVIIDRLRLPSPPGRAVDLLRLQGMAVSADGAILTIDGDTTGVGDEVIIARRRYRVMLASRRIDIVDPPVARLDISPADWIGGLTARIEALSVVYAGGTKIPLAQALAALPALPRSPDGRTELLRAGTGFALRGGNGVIRRHGCAISASASPMPNCRLMNAIWRCWA
ncbi:hypothetical protein CHU93_09795 [Sandarakinorhabdus cyanobacteriorum]|uniref:Uncharacterized protein n=1 Tax=Sandarakinorhabdus cyanobacteriorum TaxID=1981098 RepID=A0A255YEU2_9SPHN|nr:hypothetical protein [Sandarakinorhabdus cyanobacteriorum]OYQ27762.1 hypothetical protein CHU93_09795 [Sandarakinorhabdus cyanobacteriorum]